ncbi:MAG: GspH/FimT family pseudopilin [Nitrospira sp.]|nr:GspH/FimT family pseudopilin [Nitrospira sp.]
MTQEGKTVTELLVVVSIVAIVAGMALPNFMSLNSRTQIRCVAEEIASELRLAKQLALTHQDRVRVLIDPDQRELVTQFVQSGLTHHVYRYSDKQLVIEEPSAGPEILFHSSGRSATATTIHLHGQAGPSQKLTVSITGRVSIL